MEWLHATKQHFWLTFFFNNFIYLSMLGLPWAFIAAWTFSSCGEQELTLVVMHRLLNVTASLVAEHKL